MKRILVILMVMAFASCSKTGKAFEKETKALPPPPMVTSPATEELSPPPPPPMVAK